MREICTSGSEGGGGGTTVSPYPYHDLAARKTDSLGWRPCARHDEEGAAGGSLDRRLT